jgi:hypothetical protein
MAPSTTSVRSTLLAKMGAGDAKKLCLLKALSVVIDQDSDEESDMEE